MADYVMRTGPRTGRPRRRRVLVLPTLMAPQDRHYQGTRRAFFRVCDRQRLPTFLEAGRRSVGSAPRRNPPDSDLGPSRSRRSSWFERRR
jgi:hypothetical protein